MVISAWIGALFCLVGLTAVWAYRPVVTDSALQNLTLIDQSLTSTESVLTTVSDMVQTTTADVNSLQVTAKALSTGIHDANPMFDSLIKLTGQDLPAAITSTETSLASAQSSALLIDNVLSALTNIPFSPVKPYKPAVPLHTALGDVSNSLNTLTPSLEAIHASLYFGKNDLATVDGELTKISQSTQDINGSLGNAQTVIADYKASVSELKNNVENTRDKLPGWLLILAWGMTVLLIWMLMAQIGWGLHGMDILRSTNKIKG